MYYLVGGLLKEEERSEGGKDRFWSENSEDFRATLYPSGEIII